MPDTFREKELPEMGRPLETSFYVMQKNVVTTLGAVTWNRKVNMPSVEENIGNPEPLTPYVGVENSVLRAVMPPPPLYCAQPLSWSYQCEQRLWLRWCNA